MMMRLTKWALCFFIVLIGSSCSDEQGETPAPESRTFFMGFTPWPYAATLAAQDDIYNFMETSSDLVAHHFDGGVPWPEAETADNFNNFGANLRNEVDGRVGRTNSMTNKTIYLGVSPFSSLRDGLAPYWNTSTGQALPAPWNTRNFGDSEVVTSYTNYVDELIKKFNPTFVNYAIEANEYYHNVPAQRGNLTAFMTSVYTTLKARYPNITFMTSFAMSSPGDTKMQETAELFNLISDQTDMIGISIYPYAFFSHTNKGDPSTLPSIWLSQIETIAPNKPYFIAETGFLGEPLSIPAFGLDVTGSEALQDQYLQTLFSEANRLNIRGLVWFSPYDFDILWADILNDNLSLVWRDTGLKDGNQNNRQALSRWNTWRNFPVTNQ